MHRCLMNKVKQFIDDRPDVNIIMLCVYIQNTRYFYKHIGNIMLHIIIKHMCKKIYKKASKNCSCDAYVNSTLHI